MGDDNPNLSMKPSNKQSQNHDSEANIKFSDTGKTESDNAVGIRLEDQNTCASQTANTSAEVQSQVETPIGVNPRLWEKFQQLKNKREAITKGAAEKRQRREQWKEQKKKEKIAAAVEAGNKLSQEVKAGEKRHYSDNTELSGSSSSKDNQWSEVKSYIGCNDHLKSIDKGPLVPKCGLEEKVTLAIQQGEYEVAEKLSDTIAVREFGERVTEAFDAKKYSEQKAKVEEEKKAKRLKKLHWGFQQKERWETKGNM